MKRPTAYIFIGIPASGKSTVAETMQEKCVVVERDRIRECIKGSRRAFHDWNNPKREEMVNAIQTTILKDCFDVGESVILSDTNLTTKSRRALVSKLEWIGYDIEYMVFDVPLEEALERNAKRPDNHIVPELVMRSFHKRFKDNKDLILAEANYVNEHKTLKGFCHVA